MNFAEILRHIPDFPEEGIDFIDITTVLQDPEAFTALINAMKDQVEELKPELVVGAESRGFILGAPLAYALGVGFVPVRKPGRLPHDTISEDYALEYGTNSLEIHTDSIKKGQRVLIVDDLLATGGTAQASCKLVEKLGGQVVGLSFFVELKDLNGRNKLGDYPVNVLVSL